MLHSKAVSSDNEATEDEDGILSNFSNEYVNFSKCSNIDETFSKTI